jgi:uncharacterized protein YjcR
MIGASKLNEEKVRQIKELFLNTEMKDADIADQFGVSREHINLIRNGKRWNILTRTFISKQELDQVINLKNN